MTGAAITRSDGGSPIALRWGQATDRGKRRRINEDAFLAEKPVFVVADGMGGHEAGEVASSIAVHSFEPLVGLRAIVADDVRNSLNRAQLGIAGIVAHGEFRAGTTVTGLGICDIAGRGYWLVFNIGDSRTYRMAGGRLEQISVDHSVVQELIDSGEIEAAHAATHPERNVITRALGVGTTDEPDPDYWFIPAESGDRMLICSDGLTRELDDERIASVLLAQADPQSAADRLVVESLEAGGHDNLTVLVIDAVEVDGDDDAATTVDRVAPSDRSGDTVPTAPRATAEAESHE
ncbi:serine/threonine-protein phosphatase [Microbacteriaceae bacterium VKM Ac-2855]|nr:serine/threonine-protein phosphatase [Microbacteriaceae bacterium VKM Ac-2855]